MKLLHALFVGAKFIVSLIMFIALLVRLLIFIDETEIQEANQGRYRQNKNEPL